jgi:ankyrin repeat protein
VCELLLQCGALVDVLDAEGQSPLCYAALCDHVEVARLLLCAGADPTRIPESDRDDLSAAFQALLLVGYGGDSGSKGAVG